MGEFVLGFGSAMVVYLIATPLVQKAKDMFKDKNIFNVKTTDQEIKNDDMKQLINEFKEEKNEISKQFEELNNKISKIEANINNQ